MRGTRVNVRFRRWCQAITHLLRSSASPGKPTLAARQKLCNFWLIGLKKSTGALNRPVSGETVPSTLAETRDSTGVKQQIRLVEERAPNFYRSPASTHPVVERNGLGLRCRKIWMGPDFKRDIRIRVAILFGRGFARA